MEVLLLSFRLQPRKMAFDNKEPFFKNRKEEVINWNDIQVFQSRVETLSHGLGPFTCCVNTYQVARGFPQLSIVKLWCSSESFVRKGRNPETSYRNKQKQSAEVRISNIRRKETNMPLSALSPNNTKMRLKPFEETSTRGSRQEAAL